MIRMNIRDISMGIFIEKGYSEIEANTVFLLHMEATKVFRFSDIIPNWLVLENIVREDGITRYYLSSKSNRATSPHCHSMSTHEYKDSRSKVVQDLSSEKTAVLFDIIDPPIKHWITQQRTL